MSVDVTERVKALVEAARPRVEKAMSVPTFSPGMAEVNLFDVAGHRAVADRAADAVRSLGPQAVAEAKRGLVAKYGARNPERGWIGFVLFAAVMSAVMSAVAAWGARSGTTDFVTVGVALSVLAVAAQLAALVGSRWRPMNRFVLRMQVGIVLGLAVAAAGSLTRGFTSPGLIQLVCAVVSIGVALAVLFIRLNGGPETEQIDLSVEHAYLEAIAYVSAGADRAQAQIAQELGPLDARILVQARSELFAEFGTRHPGMAAWDPQAPAGAALIATHTDPDRWLPTAVAKARVAR